MVGRDIIIKENFGTKPIDEDVQQVIPIKWISIIKNFGSTHFILLKLFLNFLIEIPCCLSDFYSSRVLWKCISSKEIFKLLIIIKHLMKILK